MSDTASDQEADSDEEDEGGVQPVDLLDPFFQQKLTGSDVSLAQYLATMKINSIKGAESKKSFERNLSIQNKSFGSNIPVNKVMKMFHSMENEFIVYKFFCITCGTKVCTSSAEKMAEVRGRTFDCGNNGCDTVQVDLTGNRCDILAKLDVKAQLKGIFQLPSIEKMIEPLEKIHNRSGVIKDIYDGECFKQIVQGRRPEDIILLHSADGLQVFEGCGGATWTDVLAVANLIPRFRHKPECMVLSSVMYCKNGSPPAEFFEGNLEETLSNISEIAILWNYKGVPKVSEVTVGFSVNDLPARQKVSKGPHYGAYFGCSFCHIEGRYIRSGHRGGGNVYYPCDRGVNLTLKTDPEVRQWGEEANFLNNEAGTTGLKVHGYSGISEFSKVEGFDLVKNFVVDKMHGVYEGVMKSLLKIWLSGILKPFLSLIQERLDKMHLTSESTRSSLNIHDVSHWKANQFRTFCLIGPVILADILPNDPKPYFDHFSKLSSSCHILEGDHITREDLDRAEDQLLGFYSDNPYGDDFVTMNFHCTGFHVVDSVLYWGPFFVTSMNPFENVMHTLKKLLSGTVGVSSQIGRGWLLINRLNLISDTVKCDNPIASDILDIAEGKKQLVNPFITDYGVVMSSNERQTKKRCLSDSERNNLNTNCNKQIDKHCEVYVSSKIRADGHVLTSMTYKEGCGKKKADCLVIVRKDNGTFIAAIESFVTVELDEETYCIIHEFEHVNSSDPAHVCLRNSSATHCWLMKQILDNPSSCRLSDIEGKCLSIAKPPQAHYVIKVPSLKAFE